jgi:transcriptional regulator with XRE-family HTH domain
LRPRVEVKPALLRWAIDRSRRGVDAFASRFPHIDAWLRGESSPTLAQLEAFAKATYTPIAYLFLVTQAFLLGVTKMETFPGFEESLGMVA